MEANHLAVSLDTHIFIYSVIVLVGKTGKSKWRPPAPPPSPNSLPLQKLNQISLNWRCGVPLNRNMVQTRTDSPNLRFQLVGGSSLRKRKPSKQSRKNPQLPQNPKNIEPNLKNPQLPQNPREGGGGQTGKKHPQPPDSKPEIYIYICIYLYKRKNKIPRDLEPGVA